MKVSTISQYSVFLPNEPGALEKFAAVLYNAGLDIEGLSSDIRYEAAVVKFVVGPMAEAINSQDINRIITKAGYTSVKTEVICVEKEGCHGAVLGVSKILGAAGINITSIYGSFAGNKHGRVFLVVDNVERALQLLSSANYNGACAGSAVN